MLQTFQSVENCYTKLFWFVHLNIHKEQLKTLLLDILIRYTMVDYQTRCKQVSKLKNKKLKNPDEE